MVSILVLTASLIIIMAALYDYVDTTQREQLVDETHLAAKGVELNGKKYLHKLDSDSYRITWVAADGVGFAFELAAPKKSIIYGRSRCALGTAASSIARN